MLKDYIQLCWFKGEPHDLPVDRKFLWINISLQTTLSKGKQ
jgi:hypothetical protein